MIRRRDGKWQGYYLENGQRQWQNIRPDEQALAARRVFIKWGQSKKLIADPGFTNSIVLVAITDLKKPSEILDPGIEKIAIWGNELDDLNKKILHLLPVTGRKFFDPADLCTALVGSVSPTQWEIQVETENKNLRQLNKKVSDELTALRHQESKLDKQIHNPSLTEIDLKEFRTQQALLTENIASLTLAVSSLMTQNEPTVKVSKEPQTKRVTSIVVAAIGIALLAIIAVILVLTRGSDVPANPGNSKDCSDFANYSDAETWFNIYFPHYDDVAKLDLNGDMTPCENLPGAPKP